MSERLRSVNTRFWEDPFIEDITPSEKLLFLYLLTNPQANMLGIYEITVKRICYDTGLTREIVTNGLKRFEKAEKVLTWNNFIILPNWLKNQNLNSNMKTGVLKLFNQLPIELRTNIIGNDSPTILNDYQILRNTLLKGNRNRKEIEIEGEDESEDEEVESSSLKNQFEVFRKKYPGTKRGFDIEFENLQKRHRDWREIIPNLSERLEYQIEAREIKRKQTVNGWAPEWKNLQTWINQRCWEEEISINHNSSPQADLIAPPIPPEFNK
jgi:hypothetical protein